MTENTEDVSIDTKDFEIVDNPSENIEELSYETTDLKPEYIEFAPGTKHPIKNGDISDNPDTFRDCGYILQEDDLVIDIDTLDHDKIRAMISVFHIKTHTVWTDRGVHFYFKKPKIWKRRKKICHLGFEIEYKHSGNTQAVTIKRNGVLRKQDNIGVREELPLIFSNKGTFDNLLGLSDGEGRNDKLYTHKMRLANCTGWLSILTYVNNFIFDEPLEQKEFEELSRAEVIESSDIPPENIVANDLIKQLSSLVYSGSLYFKDRENDEYTSDVGKLKRIIYSQTPNVKTQFVDEVIKQMLYKSRSIPSDTVFKIRFLNGYLFKGKFYYERCVDFTPYTIDVEYNPNAESVEIVDNYIDHLTNNDPTYKKVLLEVLGHTLIVDPEFKRLIAKFFIFVGSGGNGKGTLLQIIRGILGVKNCTSMNIKQLSDERYVSQFKGMLANLGDDIQDSAINDKDMKILKNISTCDSVSSRELYKNSEEMMFTGSLIFTSNHLIKSFEKGESYKRRVMWLPMYTKVTKKDPLFITNLTQESAVEYWIKLIVEGYLRLYAQNGFTESRVLEEFNSEYHRMNNPYLEFLEDKTVDDFNGVSVIDVHSAVDEWCRDNDIEFNKNMFIKTMEEMFNLNNTGQKRINGKNTRIYTLIEK